MCYKIPGQKGRGRPVEGYEKRTVVRNIRLEPIVDKRLGRVCEAIGLSKSEAIRQSVMNYIVEMEKVIFTQE